MTDETIQIRLVTLGAAKVGKSAVIKRFLFNTFTEKYRPTVEDLFSKDFSLGNIQLKVDFLDTCGDMQFPAMRRLSIANANAFLLVYCIDNALSFEILKQFFEEIKESRSDFQDIPMIFVGNKSDLADEKREVLKEDVAEWVFCELPKLRTKVMECSAMTNTNVTEIYKVFLQLAKIKPPSDGPDLGLRRRSSAHARVASANGKNSRPGSPKSQPTATNNGTMSPSRLTPTLTNPKCAQLRENEKNVAKPRSRSLYRRISKKISKNRDTSPMPNADDCTVS